MDGYRRRCLGRSGSRPGRKTEKPSWATHRPPRLHLALSRLLLHGTRESLARPFRRDLSRQVQIPSTVAFAATSRFAFAEKSGRSDLNRPHCLPVRAASCASVTSTDAAMAAASVDSALPPHGLAVPLGPASLGSCGMRQRLSGGQPDVNERSYSGTSRNTNDLMGQPDLHPGTLSNEDGQTHAAATSSRISVKMDSSSDVPESRLRSAESVRREAVVRSR